MQISNKLFAYIFRKTAQIRGLINCAVHSCPSMRNEQPAMVNWTSADFIFHVTVMDTHVWDCMGNVCTNISYWFVVQHNWSILRNCESIIDRLCGPVARVPGYRSRGPMFDSRHYQIFWEVVDLEQGPLSLVSTIEELPGRKSSGSGLEIWEYGHRDPSHWPRGTLCPQKLALTSPTCGGHWVGIVCSQTEATEFSESIIMKNMCNCLM
jgi:hypothetical protein